MAQAVNPIIVLHRRRVQFHVKILTPPDQLLYCGFPRVWWKSWKFWFLNIDCFNGYSIRPPLTLAVAIFTDASDVAFGDFLPIITFLRWLAYEKGQCSIYLELKTIYYVLLSILCQAVEEQESSGLHWRSYCYQNCFSWQSQTSSSIISNWHFSALLNQTQFSRYIMVPSSENIRQNGYCSWSSCDIYFQ